MIVSEFVEGRGFEEIKQLAAGRARPHRRDHLPLLLRLHVPPPPVLAATRTRATACCSTTAAWRSWTSACSSASRAEVAEFELRDPARSGIERARRGAASSTLHRGGLLGRARALRPRGRSSSSSTTSPGGTRATRRSSSTPEIATEVMIEMCDPRSRYFGQMRHETLPPEHLFGRRLEMLTLAVLGQLRATRQLAPDRARVDLRRRAGDRARPRRRPSSTRARRGVSRRAARLRLLAGRSCSAALVRWSSR